MNLILLNLKNKYSTPASQKSGFQSDVFLKRPSLISFRAGEPTEDVFVFSGSNEILKNSPEIQNFKTEILKQFEIKHAPTKRHLLDVSIYAKALAKEAGLSKQQTDVIELGALFHDAEKLKVPDKFFHNKFSSDEIIAAFKNHPQDGYKLLTSELPEKYKNIAEIALNHHENYYGNGYPGILKGKEIPTEARVVSICDAFDSMTRKKYDRQNIKSPETAVLELEANKNGQWDPELVKIFVKLVKKDGFKLYQEILTTVN